MPNLKIPKINTFQKNKEQIDTTNKTLINESQLIAIWGSPGSGKTTLAVNMAKELAKNKKNVLIVYDDMVCPTIPTLIPELKNEDIDRSLGKILSNSAIDQRVIWDNLITTKDNYIALLGYQKGENPLSYPEYIRERAVDLLILLRHLADYIIIDCSSNITENILTTTALEFADKVITLSTADFKGLSYFKSTLPLLMDTRFKVEEHLKIVSNVKEFQASNTINDVLRGNNIYLNHTFEIEKQNTEGKLFETLVNEDSEDYKLGLDKIIKEVFYG